MFYVKNDNGDMAVKINIYEDNVFNICPRCGKECKVDLASAIQGDDNWCWHSTSMFCGECSLKELSK